MVAEIICLNKLSGSGEFLSQQCERLRHELAVLDIPVSFITTIDNEPELLLETLEIVSERCDMIILANGTGADCMGKDVLSRFLHLRPLHNATATEHMIHQCNDLLLNPDPHWEDANYLPDDSTLLPDPSGPFCAFSVRQQNRDYYVLPDSFSDTRTFVADALLPFLAQQANCCYYHSNFRVFGQDQKRLDRAISKLESRYHCLTFINEQDGCVDIELSATAPSEKDAINICNTAGKRLKSELGLNLYSVDQRTLPIVTVEALKRVKLTIATAESCTGGGLSESLTAVPGASEILEMGVCAYSNRIKEQVLGISPDLLKQYGSVSKYTAMSMARGIQKLSGASLGVGITGVAGPTPIEGKEIGTVYVALADASHVWVRGLHLPIYSTRDAIRHYATNVALDLARRYTIFYPQNMPGFYSETNTAALSEQPQIVRRDETMFTPYVEQSVPQEDPNAFLLFTEEVTEEELEQAEKAEIKPDTLIAYEMPEEGFPTEKEEALDEAVFDINTPVESDPSFSFEIDPPDEPTRPELLPADDVYRSADAFTEPFFSDGTGEFDGSFSSFTIADPSDNTDDCVTDDIPSVNPAPSSLLSRLKALLKKPKTETTDSFDNTDEPAAEDEPSTGSASPLSEDLYTLEEVPQSETIESPKQPIRTETKPKHSRWIVLLACASILIFLTAMLVYFIGDFREARLIEAARDSYHGGNTITAMNQLKDQNNDFVAWLSVSGNEELDLPVYQSNDSEFYTNHNMAKQRSKAGALYCSQAALMSKQKNLCIYGKNMSNQSMFGTLNAYQDINYLKEHSLITLNTFEGLKTYRIVSVLLTNTDAADDNGIIFNWVRSAFNSPMEFSEWKQELLRRSIHYTAGINQEQPLLALVTNSDEFDSANFVVLAQQISANDTTVPVYTSNASPKYPAVWYDQRGLDYPF